MTNLLVWKEQIKKMYTRYGNYIRPAVKFLAALAVFMVINARLGFDPRLASLPVALVLAAVCGVLPYGALTIFAGILAVGQVFAVSPIMAAVILVVSIIMYCFAVRYSREMVNVIAAIPVLYIFHVPYIVPILLGMIAAPAAVLPTACGVVTYYLFSAVKKTATAAVGTSMEDSLSLYKLLIDNVMANYEMVFFVILFVVALLVTYFVRRREADHAFETANAVGTIVCILGVLVGKLVFDISGNTFIMLIGSIVSGVIVFIICQFRMTLDYSATEHLQFEDDDYYYYVKAVPKMKVTAPEKNVKRINPQKTAKGIETEQDDTDRTDI